MITWLLKTRLGHACDEPRAFEYDDYQWLRCKHFPQMAAWQLFKSKYYLVIMQTHLYIALNILAM